MTRINIPGAGVAAMAFFLVACATALQAEPSRSYAVVISAKTLAAPGWGAVADTLIAKHSATTLVFATRADEVMPALKSLFPRYICFVAQPDEIGRELVRMAHRIARSLDDDPYSDALWGIITGYTPADALLIAKEKEPLIIRTGVGTTGIALDQFDAGMWNSEGVAGHYFEKKKGMAVVEKKGATDAAQRMADALNVIQPQVFVSSGHATEHDLQIGYNYQGGQFKCEGGRVYALDLKQAKHWILTDTPKVYVPAGNCLIGHIPSRDCMAVAFMSGAGVRQMFGYIVVTFFGRAGWGTKDWFMNSAGRFSLAEAWFINQQTIMNELLALCPAVATADLPSFSKGDPGLFQQELFNIAGDAAKKVDAQKLLGLMWDRDATAFYGDPAWDARMMPRPLPYTVAVAPAPGGCRITVHALTTGTPAMPPAVILSPRVPKPVVKEGANLGLIVADDFVVMSGLTNMVSNTTYQVLLSSGSTP